MLQENLGITKHGIGECSIVVVPAELLGSSAVVHLARSTGVGCHHPGGPGGAVGALVDLLQVDEPGHLLLDVSEHVGQDLGAERGSGADGRILSYGFQEVFISIGRVSVGEEISEFPFRKYRLNISNIVRV